LRETPYFWSAFFPIKAAAASEKDEKMVARTASCLLNLSSAPSVILTNGAKILIGPSIRKKIVKASPGSTCADEMLDRKVPPACAEAAWSKTTVIITPIVANGIVRVMLRIWS
jgi:hypothetical protein